MPAQPTGDSHWSDKLPLGKFLRAKADALRIPPAVLLAAIGVVVLTIGVTGFCCLPVGVIMLATSGGKQDRPDSSAQSESRNKKMVADARDRKSESSEPKNVTAADYALTATQLRSEYVKDAVAADAKYKGKLLSVTGDCSTGGGHPDADYQICLYAGKKKHRVQCLFMGDRANAVEKIDFAKIKGVTVIGRCRGLSITPSFSFTVITLTECAIISAPPIGTKLDDEDIVRLARRAIEEAHVGSPPEHVKALMNPVQPTRVKEAIVQEKKFLTHSYGTRVNFMFAVRVDTGEWGLLAVTIDGTAHFPEGDL